jgi:hypothetical protein
MSLLLSNFYPRADAVLVSGNQTISGVKNFSERINVADIRGIGFGGSLRRFDPNSGQFYSNTAITLDYFSRILSGNWRFQHRPTVSGIGVLLQGEAAAGGTNNYNLDNDSASKSFIEQTLSLSGISNSIVGLKNFDLVNLYFTNASGGDGVTPKQTLKINPGILIEATGNSSRNLIRYPNNSIYSGKAIRKVRFNSTIGNGYEHFILTPLSSGLANCPIVKPKTRRLETFYNINVPSGGGTRLIRFEKPTSFPFVQGLSVNLRFNFEADNQPCVVRCVSGLNPEAEILRITGANYSFIQKETVILISKGGDGRDCEFKNW